MKTLGASNWVAYNADSDTCQLGSSAPRAAYGAWSLVHGMAVLLERRPPAAVGRLRLARQRQLLLAFVHGPKAGWAS